MEKFSEIDTKSHPLAAIDVFNSLESALHEVKNNFPLKILQLDTNILPDMVHVLADDFLVDVFSNLLHNAMRFDPLDTVYVEIIATEQSDNHMFKIEFKDYGPGIPDVNKMKIFTRLIHRQSRLSVGGIGLTLSCAHYRHVSRKNLD